MTTTPDAPLPVQIDGSDDIHGDAEAVLAAYYGVTVTLKALHQRAARDKPVPDRWTQEYVDALEAAFQTGKRVRDHHAFEAFLAEGFIALPEDLVDEVHETIGPVASAYGVEQFDDDSILPSRDEIAATLGISNLRGDR